MLCLAEPRRWVADLAFLARRFSARPAPARWLLIRRYIRPGGPTGDTEPAAPGLRGRHHTGRGRAPAARGGLAPTAPTDGTSKTSPGRRRAEEVSRRLDGIWAATEPQTFVANIARNSKSGWYCLKAREACQIQRETDIESAATVPGKTLAEKLVNLGIPAPPEWPCRLHQGADQGGRHAQAEARRHDPLRRAVHLQRHRLRGRRLSHGRTPAEGTGYVWRPEPVPGTTPTSPWHTCPGMSISEEARGRTRKPRRQRGRRAPTPPPRPHVPPPGPCEDNHTQRDEADAMGRGGAGLTLVGRHPGETAKVPGTIPAGAGKGHCATPGGSKPRHRTVPIPD